MPPRYLAPEGHKRCSDCKAVKPAEEFHNHKIGYLGKSSTCKVCACIKSKKYFRSGRGLETTKNNRMTPSGRSAQLFRSVKLRAKKLGYDFDLDRDWILSRISKGCEVTGMRFVLTGFKGSKTIRHPMSPSIDRIDTNRGYTKDNCRMVTLIFNTARSDWGDEVVIEFAKSLLGLTSETASSKSDPSSDTRALH